MSGDPLRPFAHRLQARPSLTAEAVTMARALEQLKPAAERVVDDPWAHYFLSSAARRALAAWSDTVTGRVLRRLVGVCEALCGLRTETRTLPDGRIHDAGDG